MKNENDVWKWLRVNIFKNVAGLQVNRIESHATSIGFPDVAYCWHGYNGHIELKYTRTGGEIELRPAQHRWMSDNVKAGGHPIILTGIYFPCTQRGIIMLHHGSQSRNLIEDPSHDNWTQSCRKAWRTRDLLPGELLSIMEQPWQLKS